MAKKKDSNILNFANNRKIKNNLDLLDKNLADLYQQTYYTSRTDLDDSETIRSDIEKSVSAIMSKNFGDNYSGNIAKVYSKIADAHKDSNLAQAIEAMNNDTVTQTVMSTWIQGKWIKDLHVRLGYYKTPIGKHRLNTDINYINLFLDKYSTVK